jgi:hypothetical protein
MSKKVSEGRRNFLKASAVGAAGFAILGPGVKKAKAAPITTNLVNLSTTQINQNIDNLRVAYITDTAMLRSTTYPGWDSFNNPTNTTTGVVYSVVKDNMDKLACALANKTNPTDAWATIFKIPASKTWATAKAAIKVNAFASAHPSVPIVAKICEVLIGKGMPAASITIFDMGGNCGIYSGTGKCPTGVLTSSAGGNTVNFPASTGSYAFDASTCLDNIDIFINIAVNKGHDRIHSFSGVTMCLKNMRGAVNFGHAGEEPNGDPVQGVARLVAVNSCDYVVGKIPSTYPSKLQLCIVDSLWGANAADWTGTIVSNNDIRSISMGTFPGAVDYATTMKIRTKKFNASTWNQPIVDKFMTGFGYSAGDITTLMTETTGSGKGLVDASKVSVETLPQENANLSRHGYVHVSVSGSGVKTFNSNFYFAKGETVQSAGIFNVQGRMVRSLKVHPGSMQVLWDGRSDNGRIVPAGNYILKVQSGHTTASTEILVSK